MNVMESSKEKQKLLKIIIMDNYRFSDLPDEIVIDILERLDSLARARFTAVSKAWKLLYRKLFSVVHKAKEFPWLLTLYPGNKSLEICRPFLESHQGPSTTIKRDLEHELISVVSPKVTDHCSVNVLGVNFGWVAFVWLKRRKRPCSPIFLYSPFTRKFINLPGNVRCEARQFCMSHPPTSPDCVFFISTVDDIILLSFPARVSVDVYTYRIGDKCWKEHHLYETVRHCDRSVDSVIFLSGCFYCQFRAGEFAAFNVADKSWQWLTDFRPLFNDDRDSGIPYDQCQLVESDGAILKVGIKPHRGRRVGVDHIRVWKYSWAERGWRKMESLGNRVMFLNVYGSGTTVAAAGELEGMAGTIHFIDSNKGHFSFRLHGGSFRPDPHLDNRTTLLVSNLAGSYGFWIEPPPPQV